MAGAVQATVTAPLSYGLPVPTFVAVTFVTGFGPIKLSCAEDLVPIFFDILFSYFLNYAFKSPASNQVFVATLVSVADEYRALNVDPGVDNNVTVPSAAAKLPPVPAD